MHLAHIGAWVHAVVHTLSSLTGIEMWNKRILAWIRILWNILNSDLVLLSCEVWASSRVYTWTIIATPLLVYVIHVALWSPQLRWKFCQWTCTFTLVPPVSQFLTIDADSLVLRKWLKLFYIALPHTRTGIYLN